MDIQLKLEEHLKKFHAAPFLFVGSGFSRRYLNSEDWEGLLRRFVEYIRPGGFAYYKSTAEGRLERAAGLMAKEFHQKWWDDEQFTDSREEFGERATDTSSPLKIEISKYLKEKKYEYGESTQNDIEIEALKKVVIDGIITTNWDTLLEQIFPDEFHKYVGQKELLFSATQEVGEIYKIHGCSMDPDSIVLTDNDYGDFQKNNPYLAAKLLTIFIEHPVLFIGYSMSDENIQNILTSITSCLSKEHLDKLQDRLIFLQRKDKGEEDTFFAGPLTINGNSIIVTTIKTNDFSLVYKALSKYKRKFSAKQLRQIKSQLYEIVKTSDPQNQIYVTDVEGNINSPEVQFVIGVGVASKLGEIGYEPIPIKQLYEDIVNDSPSYDYEKVTLNLSTFLRIDRYLPMFKFILFSGVAVEELDERVKKRLSEITGDSFITLTNRKKIGHIQTNCKTIEGLIEQYDEVGKVIEYIPLLDKESIDQALLSEFIQENMEILEYKSG
ncbi:SIR2-like domain-containing protein [Fontibacillus panacisegetis]|uniref:SIR2-like domain-containing protein n=1 Tax=Fontibacillus panacisegetis TaxID=670482 RepID=A0A1G7HXL0_9BACL|nr:SIR2 family protein [Fontibacillus panacisegetis]SDF05240.1 SIR2-like domain-containing protein [Fontibacillus panacisegetis]